MMQDRVLRDNIQSLVDKERRLAELELLLRLSEHGAPLTSAKHDAKSADALPSVAASKHMFDDTDPTRIDASFIATPPELPSGMLRPRAGRADLSASEVALLTAPIPSKCGIDLGRLKLNDDSAGDLTSLFTGLVNASQTLRILDFSFNELDKAGAAAIVDAVKRFPRLEAVSAVGNQLGGKPGIGAVVDVCTRAAVMAHLGVSLDEAPPLPFDPSCEIIPPGLPKVKKEAPAKAGARGRSASPGRRAPARRASPTSRGKPKAAATAVPAGTVAHLSTSIRNNSAISSVSLAGSCLPREALLKFASAWAPPPPVAPSATPRAPASPAAKGKPGSKPAAAKSPVRSRSAGKGSKTGVAKSNNKFTALTCLDLTRCHIGALGCLDLAVALGPVPGLEGSGRLDPSARLGSIYPYGTNSGSGEIAAAVAASKSAGSAGKGGASGMPAPLPAPAYTPGQSVHGCLQYLRLLNLSSCGLTSHGIIPVLEAVAVHCSFMSHLILKDNYIDDAGAAALSTALRMNSERVTTLQHDAQAHAVITSPMYQLTGQVPPGTDAIPRLSPGSRVAHHLAVAYGGGLSAAHFTPIRVLDLRNNPLSLAGDPSSHPGCVALLDTMRELDHVITISGPEPSVESTLTHKAAAAAFSNAASNPLNQPLSDSMLAGNGASYPLDLTAISATAKACMRGGTGGRGSTTDPGALLSMPAALTHAAAQITLEKCSRLASQLQRSSPFGGASGRIVPAPDTDTRFGTALWRLRAPVAAQALQHPVTAAPMVLAHNASRLLGSTAVHGVQLPHDANDAAHPSTLGSAVLEALIPAGVAGHDEDAPSVVRGAATWLLHSPRVYIEWRAAYTASAAVAALSHAHALAWHVFICGPGGRPMQHVASSVFTEGSRDRLHARQRALGRLGIGSEADAEHMEQHRSDSARQRPALSRFDWQEAAGLDVPRALGQHNDVSPASLGLPHSLAINAIESAGAAVVAWPVSWHCAVLPSHAITSVTDARVRIYAEVQQTSVKGVASMVGSGPGGLQPYGVHVLEAEIVMTSLHDDGGDPDAESQLGPTGSEAGSKAVADVPFTF